MQLDELSTEKEVRKASAIAVSLTDKLDAQRSIKILEKNRAQKWRDLYEDQDMIDEQRTELVEGIERQLHTSPKTNSQFTIR